MVHVRCRTNLDDVDRLEQWPTVLPEAPRVGDLIRSARKRKDAVVELQVCRVTWYKADTSAYTFKHLHDNQWNVEVELILPPTRFENTSAFEKWYNKIKDT